jgi:hypothetical protein
MPYTRMMLDRELSFKNHTFYHTHALSRHLLVGPLRIRLELSANRKIASQTRADILTSQEAAFSWPQEFRAPVTVKKLRGI